MVRVCLEMFDYPIRVREWEIGRSARENDVAYSGSLHSPDADEDSISELDLVKGHIFKFKYDNLYTVECTIRVMEIKQEINYFPHRCEGGIRARIFCQNGNVPPQNQGHLDAIAWNQRQMH